ncbi:hypothetical protein AB6G18_13170 [Providencia hangzhouensis]
MCLPPAMWRLATVPVLGQAVGIQLPDGVNPFATPPYPIKPYCAMQA